MNHGKQLLVSLGLGAIPNFIGGSLVGLRLAFIPTAGAPYEDTSFVARDRKILTDMGFRVRDVWLEGKQPDELRHALDGSDAIFVSGGNTFYLLQEARASGLDQVLPGVLAEGVPYIGASAGAIIMGPDVEPVRELDDPAAAPNLVGFRGLNLVDFVVLPHYGDPETEGKYGSIIDAYKEKYRLIPIKNDQAVIVDDGDPVVVPSD